jgi:hypothetical protein
MSLFFIFKFVYFSEICYHPNFKIPTLNGSIFPNSQVCAAIILVSLNIMEYYHNSYKVPWKLVNLFFNSDVVTWVRNQTEGWDGQTATYTQTHLLTSCLLIWHTVKDHIPTPWKLVTYWINKCNVIPGWSQRIFLFTNLYHISETTEHHIDWVSAGVCIIVPWWVFANSAWKKSVWFSR